MNTILFDLDGTLLSMDMQKFEHLYFNEVAKIFPEDEQLVSNIMHSTKAMVMNLEPVTNESVFLDTYSKLSGLKPDFYMGHFMEFYRTNFDRVKEALVYDEPLVETVRQLKRKGYQVVLATNPLFPTEVTYKRIRWAGFEPTEFDFITTFEDCCYLKPQIEYYQELLNNIGKEPNECLMVGNDAMEDLVAGKLGISTYLITDHLLNRYSVDIVSDHIGSYDDFKQFADELKPLG
jgi:FMN phosphatase YigB (HAD superfamily)